VVGDCDREERKFRVAILMGCDLLVEEWAKKALLVVSTGVAGCGEGEGESRECEEDGVGAAATATAESPANVSLLVRLADGCSGVVLLLFVVDVPVLPVNQEPMPLMAAMWGSSE
jgi:hypothetical protein